MLIKQKTITYSKFWITPYSMGFAFNGSEIGHRFRIAFKISDENDFKNSKDLFFKMTV